MSKVKKIQEKEIELLKEFHDLCERYNLTYYALGGTLLGAIRHKGFIPWDDDMDLGMPRKDYDLFISKYHQGLSDHIVLRRHHDNLGNTSIIDTNTKIPFGEVECSPYIDIFPLDGFPGNKLKYKRHQYHILFFRMLSKLSVVDQMFEKDRGLIENMIVKMAKVLHLNQFISTDKVNKKLQQIVTKYPFDSSAYVGNVLGTYRNKEIVSREIFGQPQKYPFENIEIYGHEQPEKYLKNIYGDFMKMPDEQERVGHFESTWGR